MDTQLSTNIGQESATTSSNTLQTEEKSEGPKQKVLLLLHGLLLDWTIWQPYINNFAGQYRVISLDLRGHGKSTRHEKTKQHKYKDYFEDWDELIKAKKLEDKGIELTVITFSATGMLFLHYLENRTIKSLKNVIILSGADILNTNLAKAARNVPAPMIWQPLKNTAKARAREYLFTTKDLPITEEFVTKALSMHPNVVTEVIRTIGDKKFEKKMNQKKLPDIPMLVKGGDQDSIYPPAAIQGPHDLPKAELKIMENAKHMFPFERPAEVIEQIKMFLNKPEPNNP